jgi:hypothetical protein
MDQLDNITEIRTAVSVTREAENVFTFAHLSSSSFIITHFRGKVRA